jgi:glyoxylate reductase
LPRVIVSSPLPGGFRALLAGHDVLVPPAGPLSREALLGQLADAEALLPLLSVRVDQALLERAPRLRIVANYAVGYDNVDIDACTRRGVVVTNTPDVLTGATAELTFALMLSCARRVEEASALLRSGAWRGWEPGQLLGRELDGATLGLIGFGRIGQAVAARARAFGMQVIYASPRCTTDEARHVRLDELLRTSDVVSLHCALHAETRHLIGARELALMKPTAVLVNTARGPIIDEEALADALHRGHLHGVGLDVYEEEPKVHPRLLTAPRALLVPHIGSATHRARAAMAETAARSIADLLADRRPENVLNPDALPPHLR